MYVNISTLPVTKLGEFTTAITKMAAPRIGSKAKKLFIKKMNSLMEKKGHGKSTMDSVLEVPASGLQGTPELFLKFLYFDWLYFIFTCMYVEMSNIKCSQTVQGNDGVFSFEN